MSRCYRCRALGPLTSDRGRLLCGACLNRELDTDGVNIRVTDSGGVDYVHNTVRDRDKITVRNH